MPYSEIDKPQGHYSASALAKTAGKREPQTLPGTQGDETPAPALGGDAPGIRCGQP